MEKKCKKCALSINVNDELYTVCEGDCAKSFHAACVGLTEDDLCALSNNIIWICDPCMVLFCRKRERMHTTDATTNTEPTRSMENEIDDLKRTVTEIANTLANVVQKLDVAAPIHHSTPVSSSKLLDGTNDMSACDNLQPEESSQCPLQIPESETFSLYLTNIDSSASENDISLLISRTLNVPLSYCADVVKLVPQHKNVRMLDYVSFKVVLRRDLKPLALSASTWPKRIKFREFVNKMNVTWKPKS